MQMLWQRKRLSICALLTVLLPANSYADGLSGVKSCETDNSPPEETADSLSCRTENPRGSDTAAPLCLGLPRPTHLRDSPALATRA
jgi:hypothetical protein